MHRWPRSLITSLLLISGCVLLAGCGTGAVESGGSEGARGASTEGERTVPSALDTAAQSATTESGSTAPFPSGFPDSYEVAADGLGFMDIEPGSPVSAEGFACSELGAAGLSAEVLQCEGAWTLVTELDADHEIDAGRDDRFQVIVARLDADGYKSFGAAALQASVDWADLASVELTEIDASSVSC